MHNELDKSDNSNSNKKVWKSNMGQNMGMWKGNIGHRTEDKDIVLAFRLVLLVACQWAPFPAARRRISFDQVAAEWRVVCANLCASTRNRPGRHKGYQLYDGGTEGEGRQDARHKKHEPISGSTCLCLPLPLSPFLYPSRLTRSISRPKSFQTFRAHGMGKVGAMGVTAK